MNQAPSEHAGLMLCSHYQPIYSLAHRRTVGIEALLRAKHAGRPLMPEQAFARMTTPEQCREFDLALVKTHVSNLPNSKEPRWLFLNVHAASLGTAEDVATLAESIVSAGIAPQSVVLEICEHG